MDHVFTLVRVIDRYTTVLGAYSSKEAAYVEKRKLEKKEDSAFTFYSIWIIPFYS